MAAAPQEEEKVEPLPQVEPPPPVIEEEEKISPPSPKLPKIKKSKTIIPEDPPMPKSDLNKNMDGNGLVMISEEEFQGKFQETYYFQKFSGTERTPSVVEAVSDLMELFTGTVTSSIEKQYNLYKDKSDAKVITSIWTCSSKITERVNAAIVIDAVKTFGDTNFQTSVSLATF